jgi:hypothetical protein
MDKNNLPDALKRTIIEFLNDISENILRDSSEREDMVLVMFFFERLNPLDAINYVSEKLIPHKTNIKKREKTFFIKHRQDIFAGLPIDKVDHFADLIVCGSLGDEDIRPLWEYLDTMIALAEAHKKRP